MSTKEKNIKENIEEQNEKLPLPEEDKDFYVDFSQIPKMNSGKGNVRSTVPIETKMNPNLNDGAMTEDEMEIERIRRLKIIDHLTNKGAHVIESVANKLKCFVDPRQFCQESYCKSWKTIKGRGQCLHEFKAMKDAGIE